MARAPVSKTGGWGFESLHSCQGNRSRRHFLSFGTTLGLVSSLVLVLSFPRRQKPSDSSFRFLPAAARCDACTRAETALVLAGT
jgi:hypothetical protein